MPHRSEHDTDRPPGVLVRPRLLELLGDLRPLTVVAAPAGYGKTTLVESWLAHPVRDVTVVRLSLDVDDPRAEAWWQTLVRAARVAGVSVHHVDAADGPSDPHRGRLKGLAADFAAHGRPVVLALDCGESSLPAQVGRDLARLIRLAGVSVAVLLTTREDPPMRLHRFRLQGAICEVRADDLAFTASEVATLMEREGVTLTPQEVGALRTRTGGWPAGLRFAAMSLRGRFDVSEAIESFRGDSGNVAEYLMSEVLQRQPVRRRQLLLRSCILDELDPPLVEVLTGQHCDVQVLTDLVDGGCFLERVPGHRDRFRFHPLFREFLRAQLLFERSPAPAELHRVAARWLAQEGRTFPAIRHAVAATDWTMACRLLVEGLGFVEVLGGPRRSALHAMLAGMPPDLNGVEEALTRAAVALADLDAQAAGRHLRAARSSLAADQRPSASSASLALAVLTAVRRTWSYDGDDALDRGLEATLVAEKALRMLPAPTRPGPQSQLAAVVAGCKGRVLFVRGDFLDAAAALRDGVRAAVSAGLDGYAAELTGMGALVEAVAGHLRRAAAMATQVAHTRTADDRGRVPSEAARLTLAWVRTDEAEPALAHALVEQSQGELVSFDSTVLLAVATLLEARLLADRGEAQRALAQLKVARDPRSALLPGAGTPATHGWLARTLLASQADALTRLGRPEEAVALIGRAVGRSELSHLDAEVALQRALLAARDPALDLSRLTPPREDTPLAVAVARSLVLAEGALADHDPAAAGRHLARALRLAAPEDLRRPIRQAPAALQKLLTTSGLAARNHWLQPPTDTGGSQQATARLPEQRRADELRRVDTPERIVIPLTRKETEVLGYLAQLLTTDEIAAAMFVSVNTVRSHVRSVLRKLGVSRRNEAVRRAWDLRLLPSEGPTGTSRDVV